MSYDGFYGELSTRGTVNDILSQAKNIKASIEASEAEVAADTSDVDWKHAEVTLKADQVQTDANLVSTKAQEVTLKADQVQTDANLVSTKAQEVQGNADYVAGIASKGSLAVIDDAAGLGDTGVMWSADKSRKELGGIDTLRQDLANSDKGAAMVGIREGGTVAEALTLLLGQRIYVQQFEQLGAVDDTAAIQAAIDYAASIGGGDVWFQRGRSYTKSAAINVNASNIHLFMPPGSSITELGNGYNGIVFGGGLANIGVHGLKMIGMTSGLQSSFGYAVLTLEGCENVTIRGCDFAGYTGGYGALVNNKNVLVTDCKFDKMHYINDIESGGYGILAEACQGLKITGNYFAQGVERHHIYVGRNVLNLSALSLDIIISGNTFIGENKEFYKTGYELLCKVMASQNVTITGNTFRGGCGHVWLTDTALQGHDEPYPDNITITGNSFFGVYKGDSIQPGCVVSTAAFLVNCVIANNVMSGNNAKAVIKLSRGLNIVVANNIISNTAAGHGISSEAGIQKLTCYGNKIQVPSDSRGIYINATTTENSPELVIRDNEVTGGLLGIYSRRADDAIIRGNIIKNVVDTAIRIFDGNFAGEVSGNVIISANVGVILVSTDFAWVYGNRMTAITGQRVALTGGGWAVQPVGDSTAAVLNQKKKAYTAFAAAPTTGSWQKGDIAEVVSPEAGGYLGYVCVIAGSPGTWNGYGAVQA